MLGFAPLASSALASTPSQAALPELLAAAAGSVFLSGLATAKVPAQLAAADQVNLAGVADTSAAVGGQSALASSLPMAGQAHASATVDGSATPIWALLGQADLKTAARGGASLSSAVVGSAQITSGIHAGLQSELGLAVDAYVQLSPELRATGQFDWSAAVRSVVGAGGSAATVLALQRQALAEGIVDVALSRHLPLLGSASARLAGRATTSGQVSAAGTASADASEVSQASGQIALGGKARAAGVPASTAAGQTALGGSGAVASRVSAGLAVGLAITGQSQAGVAARGQAAEGIAAAGLGYAASLAQGRGALLLTFRLQAAAKARSAAPAEGQIALPGQASLVGPILGHAQPSQLVLTGSGTGTILAVRMARGAGTLPLAGQGHAVGTLNTKGDGALAMPGASVTTGVVRAVSSGQFGLARALEAELLVAAAAGRAMAIAGTARGAARASAQAQDHRVALEGKAIARTTGIGSALGGHDLASRSEGATATRGAAHITFAFARAFAGDVDVLGDSARLIGLGGAASAWTGTSGKTSNSVVELAGSAAAQVTVGAQFAADVAVVGGAQISVAQAATSSDLIVWVTVASMTAPRSAQSQGALSPVGAGMARSVAMGTAATAAFALDGVLAGISGVAAGLRSAIPLEGTMGGVLDAKACVAGQFYVARSSAADVQIGADAGRGMPLIGAASGAAHVKAAGPFGTARLEIMTKAQALTTADAAGGSVFTAQGEVTGQAFLNAASIGQVVLTRLGRGDLLVAGTASRAMLFLGAAEARSISRAAANLPLEPWFAGAGATVIKVAFHEQEVFTGRGTALSTVQAAASGSEWELGAAAVAYREPPALGRLEAPRLGLSGRLVPTNTGRILRG